LLANLRDGTLGLAQGSSIDGFNWEITSLLGQNMRYQPRPIPQSYAVYTSKLQRANASFIADPKRAPEAVVVDVADFKHRLPISPDSPALLEVLHHYNVSHRTRSGSLIFKRRAETNQGLTLNRESILRELKWSRKGRVNLVTDPVPLPEGHGLVLVSLEEKALERRLIDSIWRSMPVQIELLKRNGERIATYLMVSGAREGILIKPFVRNNDDLLLLSRHQISKMENPIAIRLTTIGFSQPFRTMRLRVEKI
jgi:hypothetical protein